MKKLGLVMSVFVLLGACSAEQKTAQDDSALGKQAKITVDKAQNAVDAANANTQDKLDKLDAQ